MNTSPQPDMMPGRRGGGGRFPFFGLLAVAAAAALGAAVMLLWNAVLPQLFTGSVKRIGYWQAVGLLALCRILVGGFGRGGRGGYGGRPPFGGGRGAAMREKWMKMTPEERREFRRQWMARCGKRGGSGAQDSSGTGL